MDINGSYYSGQGKRDNNEDSLTLLQTDAGLLALVADGLGGHAHGEVASQQAVTTICRLLQGEKPHRELLEEAIRQANREILAMQEPGQPMLTTVAALWLGQQEAVAANVGDTRIYQFRDGQIIYQSQDHSMAQMAVLAGQLDPSQIRTSRERNRLVRVLGSEEDTEADSQVLTLREGDRFLLCSDGFWEPVTEADMLALMEPEDTAAQWLERLRQIIQATNKPSQDNHTAIALILRGKE